MHNPFPLGRLLQIVEKIKKFFRWIYRLKLNGGIQKIILLDTAIGLRDIVGAGFVESDADIRFIRRLKRDMEERGRTLDNVISQYLTTVKPMYEAYVVPTKRFADIIIPNDTKHDIAIDILSTKIKDIIR